MIQKMIDPLHIPALCSEGPDICAVLLTMISVLLIIITLPFSLLWSIKVVQVFEFWKDESGIFKGQRNCNNRLRDNVSVSTLQLGQCWL